MARVLLLLTYRPNYRNPFPEQSYVTRLMLQQLSKTESDELARNVLAGADPPATLRRLIAEKTDGNPFFVDLTTGWVKICLHDQGMEVTPLARSFEAFLDSLDADPDAV